jgi:hypothetical protein
VLILDEASQAGYQALPMLSLAKQVIVVLGRTCPGLREEAGQDSAGLFVRQ